MAASCKTCALGLAELRKVNLDLLGGMSLTVASRKWGLSTSSLQRHRWSHLDQVLGAPDRIDEERTAADVLGNLVDTLNDLERERLNATRRANSSVAVRAAAESRMTARMIFETLGLDSTSVAVWVKNLEIFTRAVYRWARDEPSVLAEVAKRVDDLPMRKDLLETSDLYVAAKANTETEKISA